MNNNYVIYARSSRWDNDGSTDEQIKECKKYGKQKGLTFCETFTDNVSGHSDQVPMHKRRGLLTLMQYVKERKIEMVVVRDITRLSRTVMEGAHCLHWFMLQGVVVHDVDYAQNAGAVEPSNSWAYRKELYMLLLAGEDYYHAHKGVASNEVSTILYRGHKAPWGYVLAGSLPTPLIKDRVEEPYVSRLFELLLDNVDAATVRQKGAPHVVYKHLLSLVMAVPEEQNQRIKMRLAGKGAFNERTIVDFLQNPIYAGYPDTGDVSKEDRVHEHYISADEYNKLNRGHKKQISEASEYHLTYVSKIKCGCGEKNLNKEGDKARCHACGNSIRENTLRDEIAAKFRWYYFEKDDHLLDSISNKLQVGLFRGLLEDYLAGAKAAINPTGLKHSIDYDAGIKNKIDELIGALDNYSTMGSSELAVAWAECRDHVERRNLLNLLELEITFDFAGAEGERISVKQVGRDIPGYAENLSYAVSREPKYPLVRSDKGTADLRIQEIVRDRAVSMQEIRERLDQLPSIKALLEYELGYTTGDFWTPYADMLLS